MDKKKKNDTFNKEKEQEGKYPYTYRIKNGEKVQFYGDDEIKKEFDIHYYGEGGVLYYKKRSKD